jgi:hypothetical protein
VRGCFQRLPARQRRVLSLRGGLSGRALSRAEVAERLGQPTTSVARTERRGLRRLRVLARDGCGIAVLGAVAVGSDPAAGGGGAAGSPPAGTAIGSGEAAAPRGFGPQVGAPLRRIATAPSAERVPAVLGTLADGPEGFSRPAASAAPASDPRGDDLLGGVSATTGLSLLGLLAAAAVALALWLLARRRRQDGPAGRRTSHVPPDPA